ncbi:MAG: hypothetical protein LBD87_03265 [Prevotellaceae bacterium]|jgi:hypothetical protein|nr:hypothetical protein [Prevotellaceae bacterium]
MPTNVDAPPRESILQNLSEKTQVKRKAYDATLEVFTQLKELLHELCNDTNETLEEKPEVPVRLEYRDRGKFEAEIKVAGDILIFSMHSNIFFFDRSHHVRQIPYVQNTPEAAYCGMINIYNFLADSFKYNRTDDLGYLIGRIFINKDKRFFVEGKRQSQYSYRTFGETTIDKDTITAIIETAILYSIEFDLLVPPYHISKEATVGQMNTKIENARLQTGKRLGFAFNFDDAHGVDNGKGSR